MRLGYGCWSLCVTAEASAYSPIDNSPGPQAETEDFDPKAWLRLDTHANQGDFDEAPDMFLDDVPHSCTTDRAFRMFSSCFTPILHSTWFTGHPKKLAFRDLCSFRNTKQRGFFAGLPSGTKARGLVLMALHFQAAAHRVEDMAVRAVIDSVLLRACLVGIGFMAAS